MKLPGIGKKHTAINEYLRITGGRLSANFTHQYLPLFYSGSADTVMQNLIIAILGNILHHIGSWSVLKTIGVSIPALHIFFFSKLKKSFPAGKWGVDRVTHRLSQENKLVLIRPEHHHSATA